MKTTLVRQVALTSILACVAINAHADVDTTFYGSLRLGVDYVDAGRDLDAVNGRDFLSRVGAKAETEITDTVKGIAVIEYGMVGSDGINFEQNDRPGFRQLYVGLDTSMGLFTFGSQTLLFHKYVRSGYFSDANDTLRQGAIRDDDLLQWVLSKDNFQIAASAQFEGQDGDSVDQYQIAGQYALAALKLQGAWVADTQGEQQGNLYGLRGWVDVTEQITLSAFYHLAEADFDLYSGNASGNLVVQNEEGSKIGGVTKCNGEKRYTAGLYGRWSSGANKVHARYGINDCELSGDVQSYKVEYVRNLNKNMQMWTAYELLDSERSRRPVTGDDMSAWQVGVRYDF
ncbi:porin [Ferrimonas pelagia]